MVKFGKTLIIAAGLALGAGAAHADIVLDTGQGPAGTLDPNWTITSALGGADHAPLGKPTIQAYNPAVFPFNVYHAPLGSSQWDTPVANAAQTFDSTQNGFYTYTISFNGTAGNIVSGMYLSDNTVNTITLLALGGTQIGGGDFTTPSSFSFGPLPSSGIYTLNFNVENFQQAGGNPTALDVAASVRSVPEASTWAMMILGFFGLGFMGYRKSLKIAKPTFRMA
jgi:hypothetical protein